MGSGRDEESENEKEATQAENNIGGTEIPATGEEGSEKTKGQGNEKLDEFNEEEETINSFGGNWREIFSKCVGNDETINEQNMRKGFNIECADMGPNRIFLFQSTTTSVGEGNRSDSNVENTSGPVLSNGEQGRDQRPNNNKEPRGAEVGSGPEDDPFNLNEIIWGTSRIQGANKRKKGYIYFHFY
ncbi:hypothetical protein Hanom_Chr06g00493451 [Helianthus anomalus]